MVSASGNGSQTPVSANELRESCCAMREATEKMARIFGFKSPDCPRKAECLEQARRNQG